MNIFRGVPQSSSALLTKLVIGQELVFTVGMTPSPRVDGFVGQEQVERVLAQFFVSSRERAATINPRYLSLWETLEKCTLGGKRFRPRMVLTPYIHLGGTDLDAAAHVGAAFELLHTALIVHDDVIDLDFVRRGQDNVSGVYRRKAEAAGVHLNTAAHRGLSAGVIAGDLALSNAYRLLDGAETSRETNHALREILDEAVFASAAGEIIDLDFSLGDRPGAVDEILQMAALKTAAYSFECPLQAGATLAGANTDVVKALGNFGRDIGTAYQLVDDLLGVFGDESLTGKSVLGDLREGKGTILMAFARGCSAWGELSELVGSPELTLDQAERARSILQECGAHAYAVRVANDFAERARAHLASESIPDQLRNSLEPMVAEAINRVR